MATKNSVLGAAFSIQSNLTSFSKAKALRLRISIAAAVRVTPLCSPLLHSARP